MGGSGELTEPGGCYPFKGMEDQDVKNIPVKDRNLEKYSPKAGASVGHLLPQGYTPNTYRHSIDWFKLFSV